MAQVTLAIPRCEEWSRPDSCACDDLQWHTMSKPWRFVHHIVHTLVLVGQREPRGVGSLQRFQSIETREGNGVSPSFLGELMAEEFVCCSAGIIHLFLIFVLSNCRLATFHKEVHDHRYRFFLDWVQVDEAWTEGPSWAKHLTTRFCSKLSSVKCKRFGSWGSFPKHNLTEPKQERWIFFNRCIPVWLKRKGNFLLC